MLKRLMLISVIIFTLSNISLADPFKACQIATKKGQSIVDINMNLISTASNMLPIKIGGALDVGGSSDSPVTDDTTTDAMCICDRMTPIGVVPIIGFTMSFWSAVGIVETSSIPYCFPSIGASIDLNFGAKDSYGSRQDGVKDQKVSAQTHFLTMNVLGMLNAGLSAICMQTNTSTGLDHISETFVWWQDDKWSTIFAPESLLVANPIAQSSCLADSLSAIIFKPVDALYWCYGSWGSSYPQTVTVGAGDPLTAYANLATRTVAAQFKTLKLMQASGKHMYEKLCQPIPTPLMKKSLINIFPIYPSVWSKRLNIGSPAIMWGVGKDNPTNLGVMTWVVYQKRDCCLL